MAQEISKSELNNKAVKAGFFFVLMQILVRGLTFFVTPIYTRLVSVSQYGQIRVYESWLLIIVPILSLSLYRSVERAKFDFGEKFGEYVASIQTLSYLTIVIFFVIVSCFAKDIFMEFCGMDTLMYIFSILYTLGYTAIMYYQRREKQLLRYKSSVTLTACMMIPATVGSILLLYWGNVTGRFDNLVDLRVFGYYTPQIIGGFVAAIFMWHQKGLSLNMDYWRYAILFSIPLIPETLSIQIMNQSDKIMVQRMAGAENAGIFTLAATVSFVIWIIENAVWDAWLPWLYEKISRNEVIEIQRPWDYITLIFGYFSWALTVLAPEIILLLGGSKYRNSMYLVAPMVTGILFRFYSYSFTSVSNYQKKTVFSAIGTIMAMIVNVLLNYFFIKHVGYMSAAYTTAFSYFILLVMQGIIEKKVSGMRCVSLGKQIMVSIIFFAINIASMSFFKTAWFVRWSVFIIVSIFAIWKLLPFARILRTQFKKG